MSAAFLDPDDYVPDDDELTEPQGPVGEADEVEMEEPEDLLYEGEDDEE